MKRRILLSNLFSAMVAIPTLGRYGTKIIESPQYFEHLGFQSEKRLVRSDDENYLRRAIELAANVPKYPFAALLVDQRKGMIVGEGWNRSVQNPTWHGEMDAINKCAATHPKIDWSQLTLYTTAEPCAMCQGAVAWTGIGRVVFGSSIPFLKSLDWWAIDIRAEEISRRTPFRKSTVVGGVMEEECNQLFRAALLVK